MSKIDQLEKALKSLKNFEGTSPTIYRDRDYSNQLVLSAEECDGFADYYGEFCGGYPYIAPEIEAAAEKLGFYFEWEHAGALIAYEI